MYRNSLQVPSKSFMTTYTKAMREHLHLKKIISDLHVGGISKQLGRDITRTNIEEGTFSSAAS